MWYPQAAAALSWYFIHPTASSQVDDQDDFFIIYLLSSAWHYSSGIDSFSHLLIFFTRMNRHLACASHLQNVSLFITVMCVSFFLLTFIQHCMGLKGYENYIQFILYMPILLSKCVWRFLYFQTATCIEQICFLWMILLRTIAKSFSSFLSWKTCDEKFIRLEIDYFSVLILSNGI